MADGKVATAVSHTMQAKEEEEQRKAKAKARALERLQERVTPLLGTPYYRDHLDVSRENLLRWLEAYDGNAHLAEAKLRASMYTRKNVDLPGLGPDHRHPYALMHHIGGGFCGSDRQGSPVYYLLFGATDMLGMLQSVTRDQMITYWTTHFDNMTDHIKKSYKGSGEMAHNILLIIDLASSTRDCFRWTSLCAWAHVLRLYQDLCPGLLKEIVLIHPPCATPVIHRFLGARLAPSTKKLLTVLGDLNTLRHLLLRIEKYQIPAYLGGYKCDMNNNPLCTENLTWPKKIPRWMFLTDPRLPADVIDFYVMPGESMSHELEVPVQGTHIIWHIYDLNHPVTVMVLPPKPVPSEKVTRVTAVKQKPVFTERITKPLGIQGNVYVASSSGNYSLVLDNSKDYIHCIRAKIKVELFPPKGFLANYTWKTTLGDSIDFSKPVTPAERRMRESVVIASRNARVFDINSYY